ncbi:hypothetical protein, partial [Streptomyces rhizosphaericus]
MAGKRRTQGPAPARAEGRTGRTTTAGSPRRSFRSRLWRVGRWFLVLGLVGALVGVLAFVAVYRAIDIPD